MTLQGPSLGAIRRPLRARTRLPAAHLYGGAPLAGVTSVLADNVWFALGGLVLGGWYAARSRPGALQGLGRRRGRRGGWSDIAGYRSWR